MKYYITGVLLSLTLVSILIIIRCIFISFNVILFACSLVFLSNIIALISYGQTNKKIK